MWESGITPQCASKIFCLKNEDLVEPYFSKLCLNTSEVTLGQGTVYGRFYFLAVKNACGSARG